MAYDLIEYVSIDQLEFDPQNPRLPYTIRKESHAPDYEDRVIGWMLQNENVTELMGSIGEKGYFAAEPLLVVNGHAGKFEVVEGNRRLTAVKLLNDPDKATTKKNAVAEIVSEANPAMIPTEIPVIKFPARSEVLAYLGYKHITGVQPWDSLAKAKYLQQLRATIPGQSFPEQCRTLAKMIGSKSNYVRLLLIGVELYEKIEDAGFYQIDRLNEETFEFGVFYTALAFDNISKYVGVDLRGEAPTDGVDEVHLKDLTEWMYERNSENATRIGESRNLKNLNKVLDAEYPMALTAFRDQNKKLDEALRLTDLPTEVFDQCIENCINELKMALNYLPEIQEPRSSVFEDLETILKTVRVIRSGLQEIVNNNNSDA